MAVSYFEFSHGGTEYTKLDMIKFHVSVAFEKSN